MSQDLKASPELDWFFKRIGALRDFANAKSKEVPDNVPLKVVADELSRLYKVKTTPGEVNETDETTV